MSYSGNVRPRGSVRVTVANIFLALSNSGMFAGIANTAAGDNTLTLDAEQTLNARDTIQVTPEGAVGFIVAVERLTETTIRIRTFTNAGVLGNVPYSVTINGVFVG